MKTDLLLLRIAVVIVTRNVQAELRCTIESVRALADDRVRIYVVDGASTDGTVEYLQQCSAPDLEWISEADGGIYDAMNKGWRLAPTDAYILYMGAGDKVLTLPSSETLLGAQRQGSEIVIGTCLIGTREFRSSWHAGLHVGNTAHHQALLIRKSLHPQPPFDASMRVYADWDFNVRLYKSGAKAHFDEGFRSYAEPSGVSASHNMVEVWQVSTRHGGLRLGIRAYQINLKEKLKVRLKRSRLWQK